LPGFVSQSLSSTIHQFPAVGWVRANKVASEEILTEINDLRKRNTELEAGLSELKPVPAFEDLAGLDEETVVPGTYWRSGSRPWQVKTTWRKIFGYVSPYLVQFPTDFKVQEILCKALFAETGTSGEAHESIDDQSFKTIGIQLQALGLVTIDYSQTTKGGMGLFWHLTSAGERQMLELRTVRTAGKSAS
jgi:hypothetical protein